MKSWPSLLLLSLLSAGCGGATTAARNETTDAAVDLDAASDSDVASDVSVADDLGWFDADVIDGADATPIDVGGPADSGAPPADTSVSTETGPSGCITDTTEGTRVFSCDGIKYDVTIPKECTTSACGLVLDVHGATMSGKMEDNNTDMRALGTKHGYVVVQPNANPAPPTSSWTPGSDDDKVFAFLKLAIATLKIDPKRVHMTGFSQGGMMSSRFLCKHAEVFGSIAPAAGTGCTFKGSDVPSVELPVLYIHGHTDALVSYSLGSAQRDALIAAWKMTGETVVTSDAKHKWSRWKNAAGVTFEFIEHDWEASSFVLQGHCYPGSKDLKGGEPGQLFGFACTDTGTLTWGEVVMKFFIDHPRK